MRPSVGKWTFIPSCTTDEGLHHHHQFRQGPDENAPEWTDILTHHRWQSHSGQFDGVHGCIQSALMHKKQIHLCTRLVPMSICFKDFAFTKKPRRCLLLSQVFAPRQPSVGVCFNFALFAPRVSCQAAQYRCQSVILNTHRDKPAQLWKTLCAPSEKQQLQDLRGKEERGPCSRKLRIEDYKSRLEKKQCVVYGRATTAGAKTH